LDIKLDYLDKAAEWLDPLEKIILMLDNDAPGVFLQQELVRRLGAERCYTVKYPEGCKDANDVLLTHGAWMLRNMIADAVPIPIKGVVDLHEYDAQVQALWESGMQGGMSTGWPSVDLIYTVKPGRLTIVTGIPGSGKSSVVDALLINLAKLHGWRFGLYSPENYPPESHILRLVEKTMEKSGRLHAEYRLSAEELNNGREWVADHFWFFGLDEDRLMDVDTLLEQGKSLVKRQGVRGIVLDPWNEVEASYPAGMTETQYISKSLSKIRKFARSYGVHIWIVVHPTKLYRDKEGKYPLPSLYDCAGGAHWRNKMDMGVVINRPDDPTDKRVEFHVQKCRFREEGMIGMKTLLFSHTSGGYEENIAQGDDGKPLF
jgi:twinkle protein